MFDILLVEIISSYIFDRVNMMWHTTIVNVEYLVLVYSCDCEIVGLLLIEVDGLDVIAEVEMCGFDGVETLLSVILCVLGCIVLTTVDNWLKWVV